MARLLYLVHRIPYPPNKGDKIRSYNILKALAKDNDVVLGAFIDDPDDLASKALLEDVCDETYFEVISPKAQKIKSLAGLATGSPLTVTFYRSPRFQAWVDSMIDRGVDGIVLFSSAMGRFMRWNRLGNIPVWMDFVDLDSDKWRQYAASKSSLEAWVYRREARTLLRYETKIAERAKAVSFVTNDEVALFQNVSGHSGSVIAMPNGVDLEFFTPDFTPDFTVADTGPDNEIVFTGAMDYWANVDAVTWFADQVLPQIQQKIPSATFTIVGSKPAASVLALQAREGVSVTGFVEDVRGYVARAKVCVAPMRIARGVQNKVLEAMAMGKAVVSTSAGYEGITAEIGKDLLVEDSPGGFARCVIDLLRSPQRCNDLGAGARAAMERTYHWDTALEPITGFAEQLSNGKF